MKCAFQTFPTLYGRSCDLVMTQRVLQVEICSETKTGMYSVLLARAPHLQPQDRGQREEKLFCSKLRFSMRLFSLFLTKTTQHGIVFLVPQPSSAALIRGSVQQFKVEFKHWLWPFSSDKPTLWLLSQAVDLPIIQRKKKGVKKSWVPRHNWRCQLAATTKYKFIWKKSHLIFHLKTSIYVSIDDLALYMPHVHANNTSYLMSGSHLFAFLDTTLHHACGAI